MEFSNLKQDKGVAGLTILLSVITMLFVIGLLVMIFALMGDELKDSVDRWVNGGVVQPAFNQTYDNVTALAFANATLLAYDDIVCTIMNVTNVTTTTIALGADNYTQGTGLATCYLETTDAGQARANGGPQANWNVTFTHNYNEDTTASGTIENTTDSISSVTEWFDIFIVITAMVVLILLTVIIITAIRASGLLGGGETGGKSGGNIGSA